MNIDFDKFDYNPVYWHIQKYLYDPKIRYIYVYGSSSAGKTYSEAQLLAETLIKEKSNVMVYRKESTTIWKSVYNDFKIIANKLNKSFEANERPPFFDVKSMWVNTENNKIEFSGLDDPEKAKGLSDYKYIFMNELSKFDYEDLKEIRRRMRGIEGQTLIMDWNPTSKYHWIKTVVLDREDWLPLPNELNECPGISKLDDISSIHMNKKGNSIMIKTTYRDNFWIVGHPEDTYGFLDQNTLDEFEDMRIHEPYDYQVYGLGNWGTPKKGGEFLDAFDYAKHVTNLKLNPEEALHISIDNNVLPYIAISLWQMNKEDGTWYVRQVGELPAREPNNSASKAGLYLANYLKSIGYTQKIYLYGDPTTRSRNTIDDENRSFLNLFKLSIENQDYEIEERFFRKAPAVSMTGDFINAIYTGRVKGIEILINETCSESINDYQTSRKDKDGGIQKIMDGDKETGLRWEKNGHLLDTKRYFICYVFEDEFMEYNNRFANYEDENIPPPPDSFLSGGI